MNFSANKSSSCINLSAVFIPCCPCTFLMSYGTKGLENDCRCFTCPWNFQQQRMKCSHEPFLHFFQIFTWHFQKFQLSQSSFLMVLEFGYLFLTLMSTRRQNTVNGLSSTAGLVLRIGWENQQRQPLRPYNFSTFFVWSPGATNCM